MRDLGKAGKSAPDDARALRDYLDQFTSVPFLDGQVVEATIPAGTPYAIAAHSLGRSYVGGFLMCVSFVVGAIVQTPEAAAVAGVNTSKNALLYLTAVAGVDVTVRFWLF